MDTTRGRRLVAVYETEEEARAAAEAALHAGANSDAVRVADALDRIVSVRGEMHEEVEHAVLGPGNVGPFTKEMTKGMLLGTVVAAVIGALVALPFAAFDFGGWPVWLRIAVVVVVGAVVGGTVGWIVGGGFGARRPDAPLAAERGVTVTAPALESVQAALASTSPIRIDLVEADGGSVATVFTDEADSPTVMRRMGRNMANEPDAD
jgi:hypothetical protein